MSVDFLSQEHLIAIQRLRAEILEPCLDSLSSHVHTFVQWNKPVLDASGFPEESLLLVTGLLPLLLLLLPLLYFPRRTRPHIATLQSLSTFLIPAGARWPVSFIFSSTIREDKVILGLNSFVKDICTGQIELRKPEQLRSIFGRSLGMTSCSVIIRAGYSSRVSVLQWIASTFLNVPCSTAEIYATANRPNIQVSTALLPPLLSKDVNATLCLDFVPYSQIDIFVRKFIRSLPARKTASIEFTTIAPHVHFLRNTFILTAFPFLPRQYLNIDARPFQRASTPLFVSLARVTELLSSMSLQVSVKSIEQLSNEYAQTLLAREKNMLDNVPLRDAAIREWSLSGWREHRLMLAWEAALCSSGLLVRWKIVVQRR
ncbi:hypothetical protein D9758_000833 [Tetrapyrgos nigripes]|uniref:Uncharacterized protein n=1 Tax=Tetrapyrgos nigripes TaxID=182062 RepID=A0A8H5GZQ6_9AGAR|nr:hypothetical protein D9758_000833 [Tetrapyrgos nigripes]